MCLSCSKNVIIWLILLKHHPHTLDIILGISPVAFCIKISQIEFVCQPKLNFAEAYSNFASNERLPASRGFMVEENTVARKHSITLSVVFRYEISIHL